MKSLFAAYAILWALGSVGIFDALHFSSLPKGPFSQVIAPLYANDSNEVIREKIKRASAQATIEPSVVLPFWPANK